MLLTRILMFVCTWFLVCQVSAKQQLFYVGLGGDRDLYHSQLLEQIFAHSKEKDNVEITLYPKSIPHHRAFKYLADNKDVDILVGYATEEREQKYRSVPIPIIKGINGWRLSLVHKDNQEVFRNVDSLSKLRVFRPGIYHAWKDRDILEANQLNPITGSDFVGLYRMLNNKRFDFLPRSILEIDNESTVLIKDHKLNLVAEPHFMMVYPTALYFYVNKDNSTLAMNIEEGLEAIIANGVFDDIFYQHYGDLLDKLKKQNRHIIQLTNPTLPSSVPLHRKELWL